MFPVIRAIAGAAFGAAAMYLLDPANGRRRRALMRERLTSAGVTLDHAVAVTSRDFTYRTQGIRARLRSMLATSPVTDEVLAERVRSALGRAVSHPGAIDVATLQGCVTLKGPVLAHELPRLLAAVRAVRGVIMVRNELAVYQSAAGIPALQGGRARRPHRFVLMQDHWPPAVRLMAGATGGALFLLGTRELFGRGRHSVLGSLAMTVGSGLVLRGVTNVPMRRLVSRARSGAIDIQKTMHVQAPIERVFEVLAHYENFPAFMRNVREVRTLSDGHSHWTVAGPAGVSVEWEAETTAFRPNDVLAWRTVPHASISHAGTIRFERAGNGTRLDVAMIYSPPAGALGHVAAKLFGADPRTELDEDLMRLKTFLESGVPARDAARTRENARHARGPF